MAVFVILFPAVVRDRSLFLTFLLCVNCAEWRQTYWSSVLVVCLILPVCLYIYLSPIIYLPTNLCVWLWDGSQGSHACEASALSASCSPDVDSFLILLIYEHLIPANVFCVLFVVNGLHFNSFPAFHSLECSQFSLYCHGFKNDEIYLFLKWPS